MKYHKNIAGDYITSIGTGSGDVEISEGEYENILSAISRCPAPQAGYERKLCSDLSWVLVETPAGSMDDEIYAEEALDIILGGEA